MKGIVSGEILIIPTGGHCIPQAIEGVTAT